MKSFKSFIIEADSQTVSVTDKTRVRHAREKESLISKQNKELEKARLQDFQTKERERKAKAQKKLLDKQISSRKEDVEVSDTNTELTEYLEDGTDELVSAYKKELPGQ